MVNGIQIQFLGGCEEVGSTAMVLESDGMKLLFEYGMKPGKPPETPLPAPPVDGVLLTHAHLDHSGMIPWLCSQNDQTIFGTELTKEISNLLHKDSIKIAKTEGYAPPYATADIREAHHSFVHLAPKEKTSLGEHFDVHCHSAGHIPGSLMYELIGSQRLLFTGDINVIDTRIVTKAKPVKCDILFIEGTYAGRDHMLKRDELERCFIDKIDEVVKRGGCAVLPAFAVSRAQELALVLQNEGYNVWFDGMGRKVSKIFLKYPEYLRSVKDLKKAINNIHFVHSDHGRKLALNSDVILTSSGMMDGGPVLSYMAKLKDDPKNAVLLTGYQVKDTNSRLLMDKRKLDFYGVTQDVSCEVEYFDFSAHAGHSELVEFAKGCQPEKIILFHSENRKALEEPLKDFTEVISPMTGKIVTL
jgi:putative mRNA 3-end processing factor